MSNYRIESTAEADEHAHAIDAWWREHRPDSPGLFLAELTHALALIEAFPMIGVPFRGMRRLLIRRVKCHLYYSVDAEQRLILVRAIWHSARGHGPL